MSYFLIKHDVKNFKAHTLVKYETVTYSGKCYLVSDIHDTYNREWVMYYDLYKMIGENEGSQIWSYDEELNNIMEKLISNL